MSFSSTRGRYDPDCSYDRQNRWRSRSLSRGYRRHRSRSRESYHAEIYDQYRTIDDLQYRLNHVEIRNQELEAHNRRLEAENAAKAKKINTLELCLNMNVRL